MNIWENDSNATIVQSYINPETMKRKSDDENMNTSNYNIQAVKEMVTKRWQITVLFQYEQSIK